MLSFNSYKVTKHAFIVFLSPSNSSLSPVPSSWPLRQFRANCGSSHLGYSDRHRRLCSALYHPHHCSSSRAARAIPSRATTKRPQRFRPERCTNHQWWSQNEKGQTERQCCQQVDGQWKDEEAQRRWQRQRLVVPAVHSTTALMTARVMTLHSTEMSAICWSITKTKWVALVLLA